MTDSAKQVVRRKESARRRSGPADEPLRRRSTDVATPRLGGITRGVDAERVAARFAACLATEESSRSRERMLARAPRTVLWLLQDVPPLFPPIAGAGRAAVVRKSSNLLVALDARAS